MDKLTVRDIDVAQKRVLVRVDFNVPLDEAGNIMNDKRIREALPTIHYLLDQQAKIILVSHMGRPKGKFVAGLRLDRVAERLAELLEKPVLKLNDTIGAEVESAVAALESGQLLMLENVRFYQEETDNDPEFAKKLAELADVFVNDAFGTAHRAHASTEGVAHYLPSVAGFLIEKEIEALSKAIYHPEHPVVAVIGGAKVSTKIKLLWNLLEIADVICVGGAMANNFILATGRQVGCSLIEEDYVSEAAAIMKEAENKGVKLIYPTGCLIGNRLEADCNWSELGIDDIDETVRMELRTEPIYIQDIGWRTMEAFAEEISKAKTVIWNGPMGRFESWKFERGTKKVAEAMAKNAAALTIVGGGETAAALEKFGLQDKMSHVSTGGGACLEFLEGRELPGIAVLKNKQ